VCLLPCDGTGTVPAALPLQSDVEAEHLLVVEVGAGDREGEVERDWCRSHGPHGDPQAA
jgi:hypothetical protein